jgi:hypothetical protein
LFGAGSFLRYGLATITKAVTAGMRLFAFALDGLAGNNECPKRIHCGWLCRSRSVSICFFVVVLPWLVVPMPVNAAGSSDKKDGVKAAQTKSPKTSTVQSAREFVVSEKKGLFSLKAVSIELAQVLAELSKVSGVPIKLIDQAGAKDKITISFQDKTLRAAVGEVMSTLSAGGFASVGGDSGTKQTIYVVTKKGADNFRSKAHEMIDRINKGEKPTPAELKAWLLNVAAFGFPIDPQGTSMFIVPVLQLMDNNYGAYAALASSTFQDQSVISPLRSAMLELIGRHWDYPDSRNSLMTVFDRSADDGVLQGQISLALARHGEDIGDKVIARYSAASPEARFYYAQTLAALGRTDAAALLREDVMQTQSIPLRSASIGALIKLDPASTQTTDLVNAIIRSAKPVPIFERSASDLDNERIAMHAIQAMGQSANSETSQKLLLIASDESVAVDVRLTALEALAPNIGAMPNSATVALYGQIAELQQRVTESKQLDGTNKERMFGRIRMLQKMTAPQ